ncbi:Hypothetical protein FKW44_023336 [Caligus rogercresseyi]|uniref:Uncharacterized protein n=1 Tax=Caligus rogercresseyi TaxID=217165 RepID=A0A7T8GP59_CALRO|nr:Hypothetical protein FKW44_023336 [Caligus rogercresseyi]
MKEKPDVPPEEGGRTNFLGAISSSSSSSSSSTTFEVAQASRQAPPLEETEGPPASRDSLSSLFDEVNPKIYFLLDIQL